MPSKCTSTCMILLLNLLLTDTHTGTLRVWTVSKSTPLENIKLKKTGFHALHVFHTLPGSAQGDDDPPIGSPAHSGYVTCFLQSVELFMTYIHGNLHIYI